MLERWLRKEGNSAFFALYVLIAIAAAQTESSLGWLLAAAGISPLSLWAWSRALRQRRLMEDTPTSRIASAAQGYVELQGEAQPTDAGPIHSRLRQTPCLWFRYRIEQREQGNKWRTQENGESDACFLLRDASGQCVIDPDGAEIISSHHASWQQGDYRYQEWLLLPGDPLYALGQFQTLDSHHFQGDLKGDIGALLSAWKQDPQRLHQRFDLNGDGQLDEQEWQLARQAARREVRQQYADWQTMPASHHLQCPADQRPFLLSNLPPERLGRRYAYWALCHLLIFLICSITLPWLWQLSQQADF